MYIAIFLPNVDSIVSGVINPYLKIVGVLVVRSTMVDSKPQLGEYSEFKINISSREFLL